MPLVRITVLNGYTADQRKTIGESVHRALTEALDVPDRDRFQIIAALSPDEFDFNRSYLDIERSDRFIHVEVILSAGRTTEAKQEFYARLVELLGEAVGIRSEDVAITLVENQRQDWSFGRGEASYVVLPREQWR